MLSEIIKASNFTQPAVVQQNPTSTTWLKFKSRTDENTILFRTALIAIPAIFNMASSLKTSSRMDRSISDLLLSKLSWLAPTLLFTIEKYRSNLTAARDVAEQFKKGVTEQEMSEIANDPEAVQALINTCPDKVLNQRSTDGHQRTLLHWIINSRYSTNKEESLLKVISLYAKQGLEFTFDEALALAQSDKFSHLIWSSRSGKGLFDTGVVNFSKWNPRQIGKFDEAFCTDESRTEALNESKKEIQKQKAKENNFYNKHRFKIVNGALILGVAAAALAGLSFISGEINIDKASVISLIKNNPAIASSYVILAAVAADTARRASRS